MTDDNIPTADLTTSEKLDQVLRKLGDLNARLGTLEARADDRARETRPLLDRLIQEMTQTREALVSRLDRIERQLKVLIEDVLNVRADQLRLDDRLDEIDRRPN